MKNNTDDCTAKESWQEAKRRSIDTLRAKKVIRMLAYNASPSKCRHCGEKFEYADRNKKFCNHSCSASFNNKGVTRNGASDIVSVKKCINCSQVIENSTSDSKFCSVKCSGAYRKRLRIEAWLNDHENIEILPYGVRNYLLDAAGNKCCLCGWGEINPYSGRYSLVVDHVDGNSTNNNPENLRVICPNCDSLSSTYMGLNRGNGRIRRRMQYRKLKENTLS